MPWAPNYAITDELREYVRIDDAADDTVIEAVLASASRSIDYACDPRVDHYRQFGRTDDVEDRWYTASRRGYDTPVRGQWVAQVDDIATAAGLVVAVEDGLGGSIEVTGVGLRPRNAAQVGRPSTTVCFAGSSAPSPSPLADAIRVTAVWGWPAVPTAIHEACLIQSSRLLARRDAPFGIAGSPETGSEVRLLARLDPDVEQLVRPYARRIGTVLA